MNTSRPAPDRRTEIKARHRRSIIDAAASIMRSTMSSEFSVDELARQADVSRRTVFNHFASMDDVVIEVFANELGILLEQLTSVPPAVPTGQPTEQPTAPGTGSMFDELADAFRRTDLISPMVYLTRVLGSDDPQPTSRQSRLSMRAFSEINTRLGHEMHQRHPGADALAVGLLVSTMTNGLFVMYTHWVTATGLTDSPGSRELWAQLLERLIATLRTGFGAS
ncbi:TetR/AcrR family transcriptional regulator [Paeniglutamicibacter sp. R2-26]|uniref:TetR/AcrR family transcriptional regulator n=1 Tax=Paeniglutamicibacter sp. R2-26 TaxID=3144417 RepID=UPI003EE7D061